MTTKLIAANADLANAGGQNDQDNPGGWLQAMREVAQAQGQAAAAQPQNGEAVQAALQQLILDNPARISQDPADPDVFIRTNADGSTERGQLDDRGVFIVAQPEAAADLLDLIEAYAEARHRQGHSSYNAQTAAALQAVKDALAAGQATAAQAVVQDDLITLRKPATRAEMMWLLKLTHLVISDVNKTLDDAFAQAQPVAEPSYEHQRAIMEGERNASLDAYSRVIYLTGAESQLYEAGFTNGWQRASHGQAQGADK